MSQDMEAMAHAPTLLTRIRAALQGEVSAEILDSYRGAGGSVYDLFVTSEHQRSDLAAAGKSPWTMSSQEQSGLTAAWIAFALQTLGDAYLEADYKADPGTIGFVPQVTAEQADHFYQGVQGWLAAAEQARYDKGFVLQAHLPAVLPEWVEVEPCPTAHLQAMLAAARKIVEHAQIAVADSLRAAEPAHKADADLLRGRAAALASTLQYAESLYGSAHTMPGGTMHERIETSLKSVIHAAFLLGQQAAMPALITTVTSATSLGSSQANAAAGFLPPGFLAASHSMPLPDGPGFDPFCLTAPQVKNQFMRDPKAREAMRYLWANDPNPKATLAIQGEIQAAMAGGGLTYAIAASGQPRGCYYCCPWSAIYHANQPLTIGGTRIHRGQEFTYDVSAEEMREGGDFKREILIGNFSASDQIDYCNGEDDED